MPAKRPIAAEDLYALQFVEDPQISPDGKFIAFVKVTLDRLGNKYNRTIWLTAPTGRKPRTRQFTFGANADFSPRWSPDGQTLAFVTARGGKPQIYLIGPSGGEARPLTSMPNGATNPVWSPDGQRIAFLHSVNAEERRKEDSGKDDPPPATALEAKHRSEINDDKEKKKTDPRIISTLPYRAGTEFMDDRYSHIYVMNVPPADGQPGKPYRITDGQAHFGDISWTRDGKFIISTQARDPEHEPWFRADVIRLSATGRRRPFRRLTHPGFSYGSAQVSPDGNWIAAVRQIESGSFGSIVRLAIMTISGRGVRDLNLELDRTVEEFHWSPDSRSIYFRAGDRGDIGIHRANIRSGRVNKVIGGRRMVEGFALSRSGAMAFTACTPERPVDLYIARADGRAEKRLTDFNGDLLAQLHIARTEEMRYSAPDGRLIQGWLLKPIHFREGRRYPLAVHIHGGPHVMWGPSFPSMWIEWQLHAARGYAVFYCNPRGSDGYGEEFATLIQNDWGDHVMHDVLTGVDAVVQRGFVDSKRMALTGGSYAGYMTAWIVGHDQRFACAWTQRGVYDLTSFFGTTDIPQLIEREFEMMPFDDIEKSWRQSPLAYVRSIRTPLAIEHQDLDYRVPVSEAEQLYAALKRLRRTVVFFRYPREGHEMSRSGEPHHRVDRLNRMTDWFDKYCMRRQSRKRAARRKK